MSNFFEHDPAPTLDAALEAQKIIFGPVMFQVANVLLKLGILKLGCKTRKAGILKTELQQQIDCSQYGLHVLLEAALAAGIFTQRSGRYYITRMGYLLYSDKRNRVHMKSMENVLYDGLSRLEESILLGKPEGLKIFGDWATIYEALPSLPEKVQNSWLEWDHFHSDATFPDALSIVFAAPPKSLLDVGGNTGKWAIACCNHDSDVQVGIVDLPGQLKMAEHDVTKQGFAERISMYPVDMLDADSQLPENYDAIWMSQFLACFSEQEIISILCKAESVMDKTTVLYILEPFWNLQKAEAAAFSMICISLYFTCFANGNSKMYQSDEIIHCVRQSGLEVAQRLCAGEGHTLLVCKKRA